MSKEVKRRALREFSVEELEAEITRLKTGIETRGVNSRGVPSASGLDLGSIHDKISWREIRDLARR